MTFVHLLFIDIQASYTQWVERMKIPPHIERHKHDLDWPELVPPTAAELKARQGPPLTPEQQAVADRIAFCKHPPGPMIDIKMFDKLGKVEFEKSVMNHFMVFDSTV